jgi:hypothetical protein
MPNNECSPDCLREFLSFRKLIAPTVIKVLFWIGVVVVFFGGMTVMVKDNFVGGLLLAIVCPIAVRVVAELLHMPFKIHEAVVEVRDALQKPGTKKAS